MAKYPPLCVLQTSEMLQQTWSYWLKVLHCVNSRDAHKCGQNQRSPTLLREAQEGPHRRIIRRSSPPHPSVSVGDPVPTHLPGCGLAKTNHSCCRVENPSLAERNLFSSFSFPPVACSSFFFFFFLSFLEPKLLNTYVRF